MTIQSDLRGVARLIMTRKTHAGTIRETWKRGMLLLDFDTKSAPPFPQICIELRGLGLHFESCYYARSSSGNWHVVINLREKLKIMETLFVELKLGSDPKRARCDFIRAYHYKRTDEFVQILFDRKLTKKEMEKL